MRVTLDIDKEAHRRIKTLAAFNGMTMKDFLVSSALATNAKTAVTPDETDYLLAKPANAARLKTAMKGKAKGRIAFNSIEELRNALGV